MAELNELIGGETLSDSGLPRHRVPTHRIDALQAFLCDEGQDRAAVGRVGYTRHEPVPFEDVDDVGHRSRRHIHALRERAKREPATGAVVQAHQHAKAAVREAVSLGKTLHGIVDLLGGQPQGRQRLENVG